MKNLLLLIFLLIGMIAYAQVAINTDGSLPNNSAMLDVKSTAKGILIPRMTQAQRNAITSPATALMIYQTDNIPGFYYNSGTSGSPVWLNVSAGAGWSLSGNSGTSGSNFIGTTDNIPLTFKVNNQVAGKLDHLLNNTSIGYQSLYSNTSGFSNIASGSQSLYSNTSGYCNVAIGTQSLFYNTSGYNNTGIGFGVLHTNTTGNYNTSLGSGALYSNSTGNNNIAIGYNSLLSNTSGLSNIAVGTGALYSNTVKNNLVAVGDSALYNNGLGANDSYQAADNTAVGSKALFSNTTGFRNTAYGNSSLSSNTTGTTNTAIGYDALTLNTTGSNNTANGSFALKLNTTGSHNTANGYNALTWNTTGSYNTANGSHALRSNTIGSYNTANGISALGSNTTGSGNTANGYDALLLNTTGYNNTANGDSSLFFNEIGHSNTATGSFALLNNDSDNNTANGAGALQNNTTGYGNTAFGLQSLFTNEHGVHNTGLGEFAYFDYWFLDNTTCVGYNAGGIVEADNRVEIGNTSVSVIAGQVGFSTYSDERIKDNIKEDVPGLAFVSKLRPVTYNLNIHRENEMAHKGAKRDEDDWEGKYDIEKIKMTGFVAQDVERAARETGYDFSGVQKPDNPDDLYSLRYSDFVVPLVKAVQEQQQQIEVLKAKVNELESRLAEK
jgi:trimeric autotransporter adhesin